MLNNNFYIGTIYVSALLGWKDSNNIGTIGGTNIKTIQWEKYIPKGYNPKQQNGYKVKTLCIILRKPFKHRPVNKTSSGVTTGSSNTAPVWKCLKI